VKQRTDYIGTVENRSENQRVKPTDNTHYDILIQILREKMRWYLRFRACSEFPIIVVEENNFLSL
jgi:hypothetical protein